MKKTKTFLIVLLILAGLLLSSCANEKRANFHKAVYGTWWANDPFTQYTFRRQHLYIVTEEGSTSQRWRYVDEDDTNPYLIELWAGHRRGVLIKFSGRNKIEITDKGISRKFEKR